MTSRRYLHAVMDTHLRIPLTHPALCTATLRAKYHLPIRTPTCHLRVHTLRLHINLLLRLPPYRQNLRVS